MKKLEDFLPKKAPEKNAVKSPVLPVEQVVNVPKEQPHITTPNLIQENQKYMLLQDNQKHDICKLPDGFEIKGNLDIGELFGSEDMMKSKQPKMDHLPDLSKIKIHGRYCIAGEKLEQVEHLPTEVDTIICDRIQAEMIKQSGRKDLQAKCKVCYDEAVFKNGVSPDIVHAMVKFDEWSQLRSYVHVQQQLDIIKDLSKCDKNSQRYGQLLGQLENASKSELQKSIEREEPKDMDAARQALQVQKNFLAACHLDCPPYKISGETGSKIVNPNAAKVLGDKLSH